jgi:hypothetical protein
VQTGVALSKTDITHDLLARSLDCDPPDTPCNTSRMAVTVCLGEETRCVISLVHFSEVRTIRIAYTRNKF